MRSRAVPGVVVALISAAALAGCGGSASSSTPSAAGGPTAESASAGLAAAKAGVATAMKPPAPISVPALPKRPPRGKDIVYITCPVIECGNVDTGLQQAATALGWKLTLVEGGITPQQQQIGWTNALRDKPAGIVGVTTVPDAVIGSQLEQIHKAGIPVVTVAGDDPPGPTILGAINTGKVGAAIAPTEADFVTADSGGKANVAYFTNPGAPVLDAQRVAFTARLHHICPGCSVGDVTYNPLNAGPALTGDFVSYLQRHPKVNYAVFDLASAASDFGQAVRSAGLSVKIVTPSGQPSDQVNIVSGLETATIGEEDIEFGLRAADLLARHFVGAPVGCCDDPTARFQLLTKANITDPKKLWEVPGALQSFKTAWHVG